MALPACPPPDWRMIKADYNSQGDRASSLIKQTPGGPGAGRGRACRRGQSRRGRCGRGRSRHHRLLEILVAGVIQVEVVDAVVDVVVGVELIEANPERDREPPRHLRLRA